ncbi:phosphoglycerate kinase [Phenylobacterium sp. 20VBR1]|uniref:Phosphoglycerate kinase n=1 Tax=Phenylobacterium glaciei TaxID=2803784 RepID=A0A941D0T0_9CAUL|nr:phosphoglycerate kinase [Phenylobacterium glaciei]MBR7618746.1 phosphoglycerate kinase [Phenylobacterium glaciei]
MTFRTLDQAGELTSKRALVRVDFNVPMQDGRITDDTRLQDALPTIRFLFERSAKVVLLAHFGRPEGKQVPPMSLRPTVETLSALLGRPVAFADDCVGPQATAVVDGLAPGGIALLENVRFHAGEEANDPKFARELATNGDIYVNDAFSAAHRAHASTEGLAHLLPAYAGLAMQRELEQLERVLGKPRRPVMGIVGGAKVSTKLDLLKHLVTKLDRLAVSGGLANTFLFARGWNVGASYCEKTLVQTAREIEHLAGQNDCELLLPTDVVVATSLEPGAPTFVRRRGEVHDDERILDAGPETLVALCRALERSETLIWNGPLGVFETPPFDHGTVEVAKAAADLRRQGKLVAVAGGGDTLAALNAAGLTGEFTFVSAAGGAFLEWMAGKTLPGVAALELPDRELNPATPASVDHVLG